MKIVLRILALIFSMVAFEDYAWASRDCAGDIANIEEPAAENSDEHVAAHQAQPTDANIPRWYELYRGVPSAAPWTAIDLIKEFGVVPIHHNKFIYVKLTHREAARLIQYLNTKVELKIKPVMQFESENNEFTADLDRLLEQKQMAATMLFARDRRFLKSPIIKISNLEISYARYKGRRKQWDLQRALENSDLPENLKRYPSFSLDIEDQNEVQALTDKLSRVLKLAPGAHIFGVNKWESLSDYQSELADHSDRFTIPFEHSTTIHPLLLPSLVGLFSANGFTSLGLPSEQYLPWAFSVAYLTILRAGFWNPDAGRITTFARAGVDTALLAVLSFALMSAHRPDWHALLNIGSAMFVAAAMKGVGALTAHRNKGNFVHSMGFFLGGLAWAYQNYMGGYGFPGLPIILSLYGLDKIVTTLRNPKKFEPLPSQSESLRGFLAAPEHLEPSHLVRKIVTSQKLRKQLIRDLKMTHPHLAHQLRDPNSHIVVHEFLVPKAGIKATEKNPLGWSFLQLFMVERGAF
jgi:hypothetical protein